MPSFRHLSRVVAMQTLFEYTLRKNDIKKILHYNSSVLSHKIKDQTFLRELVFGVIKEREAIDAEISRYAPEWPIEKIALVERIILEIGFYELEHYPDTPVPVIINEAIEIAKTYGDENSHKFLNGVLSNFSKTLSQAKDKS